MAYEDKKKTDYILESAKQFMSWLSENETLFDCMID